MWPGTAGAFALGLLAGWLTGFGHPAAIAGLLLAALGLGLTAVSGLVVGVAGLWIESAALMLPAYLAGAAAGALALRLAEPAPRDGARH
ncbi:hypothetical protein [Methylobacterium sp. A54F]